MNCKSFDDVHNVISSASLPMKFNLNTLAWTKCGEKPSFQTKNFTWIRLFLRDIWCFYTLRFIQEGVKLDKGKNVWKSWKFGLNKIEWRHKYIHKLNLFLLGTINVWHTHFAHVSLFFQHTCFPSFYRIPFPFLIIQSYILCQICEHWNRRWEGWSRIAGDM